MSKPRGSLTNAKVFSCLNRRPLFNRPGPDPLYPEYYPPGQSKALEEPG